MSLNPKEEGKSLSLLTGTHQGCCVRGSLYVSGLHFPNVLSSHLDVVVFSSLSYF